MSWQLEDTLRRAMERADRLIEQGSLQQAKAVLVEAKASQPDAPELSEMLADISARLDRIALLDAIRQASDAQQWREALGLVDRLAPGDPAAEPLRRDARRGMVQLLRRQATAAEATAEWAGAIALLQEAQSYDGSNELLAARIADDQRMLEWSAALSESLSARKTAQEQQDQLVNPAPFVESDELAEEEDFQAAERPGPMPNWFRLLVGAAGVLMVLLVAGSCVALAMSRGMLDSLLPPTPTSTAQPADAVMQETATSVPVVLVAATETSTAVASATQTPTLMPSPTNTPAATPTATATLRPTQTPSPTSTPTLTNTPTATSTVQPTNTRTATSTVQPTNTPSPTSTPQPTNTLPPAATRQPTNTPVPSPTPAGQPTPPTPTPVI